MALKVPEKVIPLLIYLIESMVSGSMKDSSLDVKDNIILLIGMLPVIYIKLKRTDVPNIDGFMAWFSSQSKFSII